MVACTRPFAAGGKRAKFVHFCRDDFIVEIKRIQMHGGKARWCLLGFIHNSKGIHSRKHGSFNEVRVKSHYFFLPALIYEIRGITAVEQSAYRPLRSYSFLP